jgi:hypothetical protein
MSILTVEPWARLEMVIESDPTRTPIEKLIVHVLNRAFCDSIGRFGASVSVSTTGEELVKESGRAFIMCETEIEWGTDTWVDAKELCTMATGSSYFVEQLQRAYKMYLETGLTNFIEGNI